MASQEKFPTASHEKVPHERFSTYIPATYGDCIHEDAKKEERTESKVIARIIKSYYEKRVKGRPATVVQQRRAA
jgi:hypothetical protein